MLDYVPFVNHIAMLYREHKEHRYRKPDDLSTQGCRIDSRALTRYDGERGRRFRALTRLPVVGDD